MESLQRIGTFFLLGIFVFSCFNPVQAQSFDLLLKGGHVIDPKNGIDTPMDVALKDGKVAKISLNIEETEANQNIDATGLYVTPGLVDLHGHHFHGTVPDSYLSNSFTALPPDGFTFRSGITTAVDVGGAGWRNFPLFKEQVIDRSQTRILSFLNIVGAGMSGIPEQNIEDMDPRMAALTAGQYSEIVGIKVAHFKGFNFEPHRRAAQAGRDAGLPVMIDLGLSDKPLPLDTLFFHIYRSGDILTHMYGRPVVGPGFKEAAIDEQGLLRPHWMEAQKNGFIFDVGHGGGSFFYDIAIPAFEQGLRPNTISTDIYTGSMNGGMKDMSSVMSKLLNMGMSIQEVIEASTWKPAQVIHREEEFGHLSEGAEADIAVFNLKEGNFGFVDVDNMTMSGNKKLEAELTIRAGKVVYDLNGLAAKKWKAAR